MPKITGKIKKDLLTSWCLLEMTKSINFLPNWFLLSLLYRKTAKSMFPHHSLFFLYVEFLFYRETAKQS